MALEGMRQTANPERTITGYRFENVVFHNAMMVSSTAEGVETQLLLPRRTGMSESSSECNEFKIYSYSNEEWSCCCDGTVTVEYKDPSMEVHNRAADKHELLGVQDAFELGVKHCRDTVHPGQFYRNITKFGYDFGPTFQSLERICCSDTGEVTANVVLEGCFDKMAGGGTKEHLIHPTALDGILQTGIASASKGSWQAIPTMVPTQINSLWISNDLLKRTKKTAIDVYTEPTFHGYRETDFRSISLNADKKPQVVVEGYRMTALSKSDAFSSTESGLRCYHLEWKPDPAMLESAQASKFCEESMHRTDIDVVEIANRWEITSVYFMSSILKAAPQPTKGLASHLRKYLEWTRYQIDSQHLDALLANDTNGQRLMCDIVHCERFLQDFADSCPEGDLSVTVGRNLMAMLQGKVDPLDLLFSGQLAQNFYSSPALAITYTKFAAYVDLLAHKSPNIKTLEIGAGTGAATAPTLRSLTSCNGRYGDGDDIPRFSQYVYTDISPAFFEDAKVRFRDYSNRMTYAVLDIEKDPLNQGFEAAEYDLIICCLVSFPLATPSYILMSS